MAHIVVFDLDGVILKSPMKESNSDFNFWESYWRDLDQHVPNQEMIDLIYCLTHSNNVRILILTARPKSLLNVTLESLGKVCKLYPDVCTNVESYDFNKYSSIALMMKGRDAAFHDFADNALWKRKMIELLQVNHYVLFALEDYKPNADEMRKAVPVLLYEQLRGD